MASDFIPAEEVTSPRREWSLIAVLQDERRPKTCVLALGRWDNRPVLAMRWNGHKEFPIGNPQSRGLPTWFIVGEQFNDALIENLRSEDKKILARNFIPRGGK